MSAATPRKDSTPIRTDDHPVFKPGTINEPQHNWISHAIHALGLNGVFSLTQFGTILALFLIARQMILADGMDGGTKIAGVSIVILTLAILSMANLLGGAKGNAKTSKDEADFPADSGPGGGGA
jgi:hypothetical protein